MNGGLVKGINFSGSRIGAALGMPLVAALIANVGWKRSFLIIMVTGFVWAALWWWCFRDEPAAHRGISSEEREYILKNRQTAASASPPSRCASPHCSHRQTFADDGAILRQQFHLPSSASHGSIPM